MSDNLLNKLTQLKLPAMARSLIRQQETPQTYDELSCGPVEKKCWPEKISGNSGRAELSGLKKSACRTDEGTAERSLHNPQEKPADNRSDRMR